MRICKAHAPWASGVLARMRAPGRELDATARVPPWSRSLSGRSGESEEGSVFHRYGRRAGALVLMAATCGVAASALDDVLIYQRCSSKAMEKAALDPRMQEALGDSIQSGSWYKASLGVAPDRHSASCSFPISGTQGSGRLHLKAVRLGGGRSTLVYNVLGAGKWEVLVLEALVPEPEIGSKSNSPEADTRMLRRINLMQSNDEPKLGDKRVGEKHSPCEITAVREV